MLDLWYIDLLAIILSRSRIVDLRSCGVVISRRSNRRNKPSQRNPQTPRFCGGYVRSNNISAIFQYQYGNADPSILATAQLTIASRTELFPIFRSALSSHDERENGLNYEREFRSCKTDRLREARRYLGLIYIEFIEQLEFNGQ